MTIYAKMTRKKYSISLWSDMSWSHNTVILHTIFFQKLFFLEINKYLIVYTTKAINNQYDTH